MSINLTNFVKINIVNHIDTDVKGTRDTALLLSFGADATGASVIKTTKSDYATVLAADAKALACAKIFYANGGVKLDVLKVLNTISAQDFKTLMENTDIVDTKYVVVGETGLDHDKFETLVKGINLDEQDGIYHKLYVGETTIPADWSTLTGANAVNIENYVLKFGATAGNSMTLLAYLTQINVYDEDTCQDYALTLEKDVTGTTKDVDVKTCIKNNYNIDAVIDGANVRVVGGNDTSGKSIINQFMLIVLHQTLTERVLQVLFNKIKYNDSGIASVLTAMVQELNRYVNNGFLVTNKIWEYEDLYYKNQLIINKNAPVASGYKVVIMPFSTLTPADLQEHKLPMIYVLIATSYGIRKIEISGEAF